MKRRLLESKGGAHKWVRGFGVLFRLENVEGRECNEGRLVFLS